MFVSYIIINTTPILSAKKSEKVKQQNRKNYGWLTESVLDLIVKDGGKSRYDAQNNIHWPEGKYQTDKSKKHTLIPIFNKLLEDGYLGVIKPEAKSGGRSLFCGITGKGLDFYLKEIKNYKLSIEQLWQISFNFFNTEYEYNITNKKNLESKYRYKHKKESVVNSHNIDDLFTLFEQNTLKISRKYFNSLSPENTLAILNRVIEKTKDNTDEIIYILQNIALGNRPRLIQNVDKKINLESDYYVIGKKKDTNNIMHFLQSNKLIYLHMKRGYQVSILGMLFLFYFLSNLKKWDEIDELISRNSKVLPLIFNHWKSMKKEFNVSTENLIEILLLPHLTKTSEVFSFPRDTIETRLIGIQYDLESFIISELKREFDIGFKFVKKWSDEHKCTDYLFQFGRFRAEFIPLFEKFSNNLKEEITEKVIAINKNLEKKELEKVTKIIFDNFDALRKLGELYVLSKDVHDEGFGIVVGSDDEDEKFKPVQNIISFYFYIMFASNMNEENWTKVLGYKFKNSDLKSWWNDWLSALIEFDKSQSKKVEEFADLFKANIQKIPSA